MTDAPTAPALKIDDGQVHEKSRNYGKVPAALMHDTRLTDGAIRLYAHMRWRYGNNHRNFEGRKSMAEMLGVSEKTISNRVKELEAAGWVVVVEREYNEKSGKYQTPFYHVFETRRSARLFRKDYKLQEGERIRPRPDLEARKTRVGVGGKPAHKPKDAPAPQVETPAAPELPDDANRENLSSPGNSSSLVPGNSSSHYSDAGLSRSKEVKDSAPAEADAPPPPLRVVKSNPWYDAIKAVWKYEAALNGDTAKMLQGKATKKGYKEYNLEVEITPQDLIDWAAWYRETQLHGDPKMNMLEVREKVQSSITGWYKAGKPKALSIPAAELPAAAPPPDLSKLEAELDNYWTFDADGKYVERGA